MVFSPALILYQRLNVLYIHSSMSAETQVYEQPLGPTSCAFVAVTMRHISAGSAEKLKKSYRLCAEEGISDHLWLRYSAFLLESQNHQPDASPNEFINLNKTQNRRFTGSSLASRLNYDKNANKIKVVQHICAGYVTGKFDCLSSVSFSLDYLNWQSVDEKRRENSLAMMYRVLHI